MAFDNPALGYIYKAIQNGKSYSAPVERVSSPLLRTLLHVVTGLPFGERLDLFSNYVQQQRPKLDREMSIYTGSTPKIQADTIASLAQAHGSSLLDNLRDFNAINRDSVFTEYDEQQDYRKNNRLRARYFQPGDTVGQESKTQTASDLAQVALFSHFKINNPDTGSNNSVYLDNRRNDYLRFHGPLGCPRPPDNLDRLVLPFQTLQQYRSDQPIRAIVQRDMFKTIATDHVVRGLGHTSVGLSDQIDGDIMEDVVQLPPKFKPVNFDVPALSMTRSLVSPWRSTREVYQRDTSDRTSDRNLNPIYTQ